MAPTQYLQTALVSSKARRRIKFHLNHIFSRLYIHLSLMATTCTSLL